MLVSVVCCCSRCRVQLFWDSKDWSPPGSSVPGISQALILELGSHFFLQGIFLTQKLNLHLLHWHAGSLPLSHQGSPSMWIHIYLTHSFLLAPSYYIVWCFDNLPSNSLAKNIFWNLFQRSTIAKKIFKVLNWTTGILLRWSPRVELQGQKVSHL